MDATLDPLRRQGRRGGRQRGGGRSVRGKSKSSRQHGPFRKAREELGTNADRYIEEGGMGNENVDDARPMPKSQGEDLQELLQSLQFNEWGAYGRYQALIEDLEFQPPFATNGSESEELSLDPQALANSLSMLPLTQVLDIDERYLESLVQHPPLSKNPPPIPDHTSLSLPQDSATNSETVIQDQQLDTQHGIALNLDTEKCKGDVKVTVDKEICGVKDGSSDDLDALLDGRGNEGGDVNNGVEDENEDELESDSDLDALLDMSRKGTSGQTSGGSQRRTEKDKSFDDWLDSL